MMLLETYKSIKELLKGGVSSKSFDFKGDKGIYTVKFIEKDGKMNYAIVISGSIVKKSETFTSKTKMLEEDLFSIISKYGFKSKDGEKPIIKDFSKVGKIEQNLLIEDFINKEKPKSFFEKILNNKKLENNNETGIDLYYGGIKIKLDDLNPFGITTIVTRDSFYKVLICFSILSNKLKYKRFFEEKIEIKNKKGLTLIEFIPITFSPDFGRIFYSSEIKSLQGYKIKNLIENKEYIIHRKITNPFVEANLELLEKYGIKEQNEFRLNTIKNEINKYLKKYKKDIL